jgi:hypothetical protein
MLLPRDTRTNGVAMAATAGIENLGDLAEDIGEVEFKHTLVAVDEGKVPVVFRGALRQPQRRKVYFYDTRKLELYNESGLVLRARVTQGDDADSTVKVRPASLKGDAPWREIGGVEVELDVSGKGPMCSAKLEDNPEQGEVEDVEVEQRPIGSLFSHRQEDLVKAYAPEGVGFDDVKVLGPVDARKWVFDDLDDFPYKLCIEEWSLPDTTRFIELSIRVKRKEASRAQATFHALLERIGVEDAQGQEQKTPRVLKFFADRLAVGR